MPHGVFLCNFSLNSIYFFKSSNGIIVLMENVSMNVELEVKALINMFLKHLAKSGARGNVSFI